MDAAATTMLARLRSGAWLDRRILLRAASALLALEIAAFLFLVAGTHGWIVPLEKPTTTDYASFYAAGQLANAGAPTLAYDPPAHYAAEQRATAPGIGYQFFFYPPVYLLLCAGLARLPYLAGFCLFIGATFALYLIVGRAILKDPRSPGDTWRWLVPLLAFPAVYWTAGLGQNALLTAALFGAATLFVDRCPVLAGLLFGALCYKPHFGLLIPVALAAGGRWRAFAGAAVSAGGLLLASVSFYGIDTWQAFLRIARVSHIVYESGRIDLSGFISPFGALLTLGSPPAPAYAVQMAATALAAVLVALVWRRGLSLPIRAATLAAATLFAVPVALLYDLMLGAVAGAWLVRAGREDGFLPWEKTLLAAIFPVPLVARGIGDAWHLPVAALSSFVLVGLVARRALRDMAGKHEKRVEGASSRLLDQLEA